MAAPVSVSWSQPLTFRMKMINLLFVTESDSGSPQILQIISDLIKPKLFQKEPLSSKHVPHNGKVQDPFKKMVG